MEDKRLFTHHMMPLRRGVSQTVRMAGKGREGV